jgi:hydroxyacylglutathione hydrolase
VHIMNITVKTVPVTPFQQNCSIVMCNKSNEAAIVDPGGDVDLILNAAKEMSANIKKIILTHGHLDHVGGVKRLSNMLSLPIIGPHKDDAFWIDKLLEQGEMFGFKDVEKFTPSHWLSDGDHIQIGNVSFLVIHTPGHTPGHVVFYSEENKLIFVGDVLFKGSIGRTDFPKSNHQQLIDSIKNKVFPLGRDIVFISGHGATSTLGQEMDTNPFVSGRAG